MTGPLDLIPIGRASVDLHGTQIGGPGASEQALADCVRVAARHALVKGFAVGRTVHAKPGRAWLAGEIDDATAIARRADSYARLCAPWDRPRAEAGRVAA